MKKCTLSAAILFSCISSSAISAESILSFDWDLSQGNTLTDGWEFIPAGEDGCAGFNPEQDKFCTSENRLFLLYPSYDSDHKGWMRYGVAFPDGKNSISGNALKMVFTGGRAEDENGMPQDYGDDVRSYASYKSKVAAGSSSLYAERLLPGQPAIYYKPINSNVSTLGIFPNSNRFITNVWMPPRADRHARYSRYDRSVSSPSQTIAWYPFIDSPKASHYYHHATNRPYGGWIKVEFDGHPTHNNAGPFNDTHSFSQGGRDAPGDSVDYFKRIASFALRFHGIKGSVSPTTVLTDDWERDFSPFENEETIANLGLGFDPEQKAFDVSLEDKYRCGSCIANYEVKYSFAPIDNGNFDSAKSITKMENFFIEDDNEDNLLIKPNGGYNAVWGKVFIEKADSQRFLDGEKIYVAVKDVTTRTVTQDPLDFELITTPHGDIEMQRLVKVIDMTYRSGPVESGLHLPSSIHAKLQSKKEVPFEFSGSQTSSVVESEADYALRAEVQQSGGDKVLKLDPWQVGEYGVILHSVDEHGDRVQVSSKVSVDGPLCDYNVICSTFVLADFSDGESGLNYEEFNSFYSDTYSSLKGSGFGISVGSNGTYNYQGIEGSGVRLDGNEAVIIRLKNMGDEQVEVQPRVSSLVKERPANTLPATWRLMSKFELYPGEEKEWIVPVQEFAQGYLSKVTVGIGADSQDVLLKSISLLSQRDLTCVTCDSVLVDFFSAGTLHKMPQPGWDTILKDSYTNEVNDGMGITIGSNGQYNYQGIKGTRNLSNNFKVLAFYWVNNGTTPYTFAPRYSFDDPDRPISGVTGAWFSQSMITIAPGETFIDYVNMKYGATMVNSNVNINQKNSISLNKILGLKSIPLN